MIEAFLEAYPSFDESNYIAPNATLIGDVSLGHGASVWFNTVLRGDVNWIKIGERSNIQDNCVVHVTNGTGPTVIGAGVTVGHSVTLHGCVVEDNVLVGIGAVVLDGAIIGENCIVGARALVTPGTRIPPGSMVLGSPARVVRALDNEEVAEIAQYAENYLRYSAIYRGEEKPSGNPFYDARRRP
jgi:carbonic anhydrase/acetyltransferase-like protein (isoleucine patch superfamily)